MKRIEISKLIENAVDCLNSFQLKPSTITAYERKSFNPVKIFSMNDRKFFAKLNYRQSS